MQIVYLANFQDKRLPSKDIEKALKELGHKVTSIEDTDYDPAEVVRVCRDKDLLLFHTGGVCMQDLLSMQLGMMALKKMLGEIKCKKAFWFFNKILFYNEAFITEIEPLVDCGFLNDGTYCRRIIADKIFPLHCGAPEYPEGKFREEYACDIAYVGNVYGDREAFVQSIKQYFGSRFRIFTDVYGQDFADLCKSAKIMIVPRFPCKDFYWQDDIYRILSAGGFCIHPKLEGLKDEGFIDGQHYVAYLDLDQMLFAIQRFLMPEAELARKGIARAGKMFIDSFYTYENRLNKLIAKIKNEN